MRKHLNKIQFNCSICYQKIYYLHKISKLIKNYVLTQALYLQKKINIDAKLSMSIVVIAFQGTSVEVP